MKTKRISLLFVALLVFFTTTLSGCAIKKVNYYVLTDISELYFLENYSQNSIGDKYAKNLEYSHKFCKKVKYGSGKFCVYAYLFKDNKIALKYCRKLLGSTVNAMDNNGNSFFFRAQRHLIFGLNSGYYICMYNNTVLRVDYKMVNTKSQKRFFKILEQNLTSYDPLS